MFLFSNAHYLQGLQKIKKECLALLPYGSPDWMKFENNPETENRFTDLRREATIAIKNIQVNYKCKLLERGVPQDEIDDTIQQDCHQFELRKQYALLSVKLIEEYGVAACYEMTYLALIQIKTRFPELTVQFATLKYYNHDFVVVDLPNGKQAFDLFGFGFNNPVIFPVKDLKINMAQLKLEKYSPIHITPLNKKYMQVWEGLGDAPLNEYSVKLEIKYVESSKQASTTPYSSSSLCTKMGVFAVGVAVAGVASYCFASSFTK